MRTYEVLTDPDLSEQWKKARADEQAHELIANRSSDEKIAGSARAKAEELTAEREGIEQRIVDAARIITTDLVDPKVWGRAVAQNPPRRDDEYDSRLGVNTDTFDAAIMPHAITSVVDGHGETVEWDWTDLRTRMTAGKYEQIIGDTLRDNMGRDAVPFSLAEFRARQH